MKSRASNHSRNQIAAAFVLFSLVALLLPGAFAGNDKKKDKDKRKEAGQSARVIAHLPLEGAVARQMFLQAQNGKPYLYIDQGAKQGYTVVDVSKSSQPVVVNRVNAGKLQIVGSGIVITGTPEGEGSKTMARSSPPTESVKVLDTTDPANPRTVRTFTGVTSVIQDSGRGLIYLTNDEGLWIVSSPVTNAERVRAKRPCDSGSAIAAMPPDCQ